MRDLGAFVQPSRLPPAQRCDNCRRVVTPTVAAAIFADGRIHAERRLCSACLCAAKDAFAKPASWLDTALTR